MVNVLTDLDPVLSLIKVRVKYFILHEKRKKDKIPVRNEIINYIFKEVTLLLACA